MIVLLVAGKLSEGWKKLYFIEESIMKPKTLKAEPELLIFSKEIKMKFAPKKETVVPVEIS